MCGCVIVVAINEHFISNLSSNWCANSLAQCECVCVDSHWGQQASECHADEAQCRLAPAGGSRRRGRSVTQVSVAAACVEGEDKSCDTFLSSNTTLRRCGTALVLKHKTSGVWGRTATREFTLGSWRPGKPQINICTTGMVPPLWPTPPTVIITHRY